MSIIARNLTAGSPITATDDWLADGCKSLLVAVYLQAILDAKSRTGVAASALRWLNDPVAQEAALLLDVVLPARIDPRQLRRPGRLFNRDEHYERT